MKYLANERIVSESDNKEIVVTTHRVRHTSMKWGKSYVTSIMINELDSCEIRSISSPFFLVAAAISALGGITAGGDGIVYGFTIGLLFVGAYIFTRKQVISLKSSNSVINLKTVGMNIDTAKSFIDSVESAKNERYLMNFTT